MRESKFQSRVIREIKEMFPDCIVMKSDPSYIQGIPDLLILNGSRWAALEVKNTKLAHHQPNQDYYIREMNDMSYAAFIYPENERKILDELQLALQC